MHDSQVALPLAAISQRRVVNLYDLMDAAYDAPEIYKQSIAAGHVPIIDRNPRPNAVLKAELLAEKRRQRMINLPAPEKVRFNVRTTVERANSRLKDDFGGRTVRVRGHAKVFCHLMFGILALTVEQILNFVT